MSAFTIWTAPAVFNLLLAKSTEYGLTFGIGYFGEVWFRFEGKFLYCHMTDRLASTAIMERRNS